jgi:hypothetical protein
MSHPHILWRIETLLGTVLFSHYLLNINPSNQRDKYVYHLLVILGSSAVCLHRVFNFFLIVLTTNSGYFLNIINWFFIIISAGCFLWGTNWTVIYYLDASQPRWNKMTARIRRPLIVIAFNANGIWRRRYELSQQPQDLHIDVALLSDTHL